MRQAATCRPAGGRGLEATRVSPLLPPPLLPPLLPPRMARRYEQIQRGQWAGKATVQAGLLQCPGTVGPAVAAAAAAAAAAAGAAVAPPGGL